MIFGLLMSALKFNIHVAVKQEQGGGRAEKKLSF